MKNDHAKLADLLPFYAAGTADPAGLSLVEKHLPQCPYCQGRLQEWREIGHNVKTVMTAYQRQLELELPPLKLPAYT